MLESEGKVYTYVVGDTITQTIQPIMVQQVEKGVRVISDSYRSYRGLEQIYSHITVKHKDSYITSGDEHTNTTEGFWSLLKRGVVGIYHFVSVKHLHRYCDEFSYRYNTRKDKDTYRFEDEVTKVASARLTYKRLIAIAMIVSVDK